jgi:uncharacterized protein YkwD
MKRLACLLLFASFATAWPSGPDKEPPQQALFRLGNEFRVKEGKKPLRQDAKLTKAAQGHADNIARQDKFGDDKDPHVLDGKDVDSRVDKEGYDFAELAENCHLDPRKADPASVIESWKNSPGHRKNLLDAVFVDTGVGAAKSKSGKWYFVQVYGKPAKGK